MRMDHDTVGVDWERPAGIDETFRILRSRDRRVALYYLLEHGSAGVEEITDVITGWSAAFDGRVATEADRTRVRTELSMRHLPMLIDASLVARGPDDETVRLTAKPDPLVSTLRKAVEREGRTVTDRVR